MAIVQFSRRAESDLLNISKYTLDTWGAAQADHYLSEIEACCNRLAVTPMLGRSCDEVSAGLRRMEQGKHVVFYLEQRKGIWISRVLHQSMLPERHEMDDGV